MFEMFILFNEMKIKSRRRCIFKEKTRHLSYESSQSDIRFFILVLLDFLADTS